MGILVAFYEKLLEFKEKYTFCKALGKYHEEAGYRPVHLILEIDGCYFKVTYLDGVFSIGEVVEISEEKANQIKSDWLI